MLYVFQGVITVVTLTHVRMAPPVSTVVTAPPVCVLKDSRDRCVRQTLMTVTHSHGKLCLLNKPAKT